MIAALGAVVDRLLDVLIGGAYRKFGPKRYELRLEIRKLLIESLGQIDPKKHVRSNQVRATLDGLQNRVDLLPKNDRVNVLAAIKAFQSVEGSPPSAYEDQVVKDAWKAACAAARIPVSEAVDYLNRRLRV